ncbi:MAG: TolC family protein [Tannerellaceae bacterium]
MKHISLFILLLSLGSCGLYTPYKQTNTVPDNLYGVTSQDTSSIADMSWRDILSDQNLQVLIDSALKNNTDLKIARLRIDQAKATLMTSKLAYAPSLSLGADGTISSFDGSAASKIYSVPVSASWEIDFWGRLLNAKRKSQSALIQSEDFAQAVQTELIANLSNLYFTLLMLDAQHAVAVETEAKWKESVEVAMAMKEAGIYTEAAVAQTEANYYNICTSIKDLKEQINTVENSINSIIAETPQTIQRGKLRELKLPTDLSIGIPLQLLHKRPDVRSAEQNLAQYFYSVGEARSAFYPSIRIGGSAGWTNSAGGYIVNPGKVLLSAIGSLTQPLFNKGQNVARLKIAKSQYEAAQLQFHQTLLNAGVEVNNAFTQLETAKSKKELYSKQIESLKRAVESTQLLMEHGSTNYLEVLTAEQTLLSARFAQISNIYNEARASIFLYQALGGGTY